ALCEESKRSESGSPSAETMSRLPPSAAEIALSTLHKLVAYAFVRGESTPGGRPEDDSPVAQVVRACARCAESSSAQVQLAVVRSLLTLATAEHFAPHGDLLLRAVRGLFNLALSGAGQGVLLAARSALLQALNTVVRRQAHQVLTPAGTPAPSSSARRTLSDEALAACRGEEGRGGEESRDSLESKARPYRASPLGEGKSAEGKEAKEAESTKADGEAESTK
ncbi:hypothetical protein H632_c4013p0, partial [Helicosporidium sp. ATCC 50920]